jgi:hypothetical protein
MNIAVCQYKHPSEVIEWLEELKCKIDQPFGRVAGWRVKLDGGSSLEIVPHKELPVPSDDVAIAIVVRQRGENGQFELKLDEIDRRGDLRQKFRGGRFDAGKHLLSVEPGVFAVRALTELKREDESHAVRNAVRELLNGVEGRWCQLHLYLPSAGGTVPPVYGFIEAIRAFGNWVKEKPRHLHLTAHVGAQVLLNLTSGHIALHELLTSTLIRFWAVVNTGSGGEPIRRVLYRKPETQLKDVLTDVLGVTEDVLSKWSISVCPSPRYSSGHLISEDTSIALSEAGVVFGSVLTLNRKRGIANEISAVAKV